MPAIVCTATRRGGLFRRGTRLTACRSAARRAGSARVQRVVGRGAFCGRRIVLYGPKHPRQRLACQQHADPGWPNLDKPICQAGLCPRRTVKSSLFCRLHGESFVG